MPFNQATQVNIKSIGRKRFARLSDNQTEIQVRKHRTIMEFQSFSGGREHALGQRRPLHLAVCGGEQKVGFGKRKSDFKRIPGTRYTPAIASTSRLTGPFLLNCLRSCNSYDCQNSNFEQFQDCLFVVEIHGENIALMDNTGRYLSPGSGSQAVLKTK